MEKQQLEAIGDVARDARQRQQDLDTMNLMAGIEWSHREKIRSLEGHYGKIEDICSDLLWGEGTDTAVYIAEGVWGPVEDLD